MKKIAQYSKKTIVIFILFFSYCFGISLYFTTNPAFLNLPEHPKYFLRYLSINALINNNSFNASEINYNFAKDPLWEDTQKQDIFDIISPAGLSLNADAMAMPVEFSTRLFSVSLAYRELANGKVSKELFDLALFGNDLNRQYNIDNLEFNLLGYYDFALAGCYPLLDIISSNQDDNIWKITSLNVGARLHYQKGANVTMTDSAQGFIITTADSILARLKLFQKSAYGGNSFAFDLGLTAQFQNQTTFGLALLGLNTGFIWNTRPTQRKITVNIDSFSLFRYIENGDLNNFYRKKDSSYAIESFKTSLPAQILFQASHQPIKYLGVNINYLQYLTSSRFIKDFSSSLELGIILTPIKQLNLGLAYTTDFKHNYRVKNSLGLLLGGFSMNIFINSENGYFKNAHGLNLGLCFGQQW